MDREYLEKMCLKFGFTYDILGDLVRVVSKRKDEWYFEDLELDEHSIKLYHGNTRNDANMHSQGKHRNLECVFRSIRSHDERDKPGHRNNKLTRLTALFNQIHVIAS